MSLFFWFDLFLEARAEILKKISLVFWSKPWHQKDILKLTDLYLNHFKIYVFIIEYSLIKYSLRLFFLIFQMPQSSLLLFMMRMNLTNSITKLLKVRDSELTNLPWFEITTEPEVWKSFNLWIMKISSKELVSVSGFKSMIRLVPNLYFYWNPGKLN